MEHKAPCADGSPGNLQGRLVAWVLLLTVFTVWPSGISPGQENQRTGASVNGATLAGRIFISTPVPGSELSGTIAVDPNDFRWKKITPESTEATVSPDGRFLALMRRNKLADLNGVWVFDTNGAADPKRVYDRPGVLAWSGDGGQILVGIAENPRNAVTFETWGFNVNGEGNARVLVPKSELLRDWSADGKWILTSSARPGRDGAPPAPRNDWRPLWIMHPDGTEEKLVVPGNTAPNLAAGPSLAYPRFSPDSRKIVYCRYLTQKEGTRSRFQGEVWVVDNHGTNGRCVVKGSAESSPLSAAWSRDGRMLAVSFREVKRFGDVESTSSRIRIVNLSGDEIREVKLPESKVLLVLAWK
jgi:hypothetical protein